MTDRLRQLFQFLNEAPEDAFTLYSIAYEYQQLGQLEEALTYYHKLRELHPDYVGLYYHVGKVYFLKEEFEAAQEAYEAGLTQARAKKDRHAESELQRAMTQLRDEMEDW